ncbi:hypothetical protein [Wukongibacter sp. M2B1]|uniref:hypothetical protein n=1 Tax=Wukongibacter sp. M2B1 TaxID=3088895 RepID=UPI003D7A636E
MKITILSMIMSLISMTLFFTPCIQEKQDEKIVLDNNLKTYKNEDFGFSVEYPENWKIEEKKPWGGDENYEGSTDSGINIYVGNNKDESIYIFEQSWFINVEDFETLKEEFVTDGGVKGSLFINIVDNRYIIDLILGEGFNGAYLYLSKECFDKNKEQIFSVLRSIKILNEVK